MADDNRITVLQLFKAYKGNFPLHNALAQLDPERFRTVACYLGGEPDGENGIEALAGRTEYFGCAGSRLRWYNLALLRRLKTLIEDEHVHIVNCQLHRTTPLGILAARLAANRPVVLSSVHGMVAGASPVRRVQYRLLGPGLHRYVTVSEAVGRSLRSSNPGLVPERVVTIRNGLDLGRFNPPGEGEKERLRGELFPSVSGRFWFGTAGRLSAVKNHATLLRAFARALEKQPGCCLLIAGRGELDSDLRALAASLGIRERVHFLGYCNDLPQVFKTLDGYIFPSLREGLPLALIEAMAAGLPVLASDAGGIPEVVGDELRDALVHPGDVDGLAAAMVKLAALPAASRQARGAAGRSRVLAHFQARRMIDEYEHLYEECYRHWLAQSRPAGGR